LFFTQAQNNGEGPTRFKGAGLLQELEFCPHLAASAELLLNRGATNHRCLYDMARQLLFQLSQ
jgi:hypothetical protein